MAKYDVTYRCGHTGTVELYGKNEDRARRLEGLKVCDCPACEAASKRAAAERQVSEDRDNGLPTLTGSEKQVNWAVQLRHEFIRQVEEFRQNLTRTYEQAAATHPELAEKHAEVYRQNMDISGRTLSAILAGRTAASWWIENRDRGFLRVLQKESQMSEILDSAPAASVPDDTAAKAEATVTPEECSRPGAVEVSCQDGRVALRYVKDEAFREVVRGLRYTWDGGRREWARVLTKFNGTPEDRAAEAANALLRAGFAVTIYDDAIRDKAVRADYEPECDRWVMRRTGDEHTGKLAIRWPKGDQALYDAARKIHGSKWSNPDVVVPVDFWPEVLDFAECNGFRVSDGARQAIDEYEAAKRAAVSPAEPAPEPEREDRLKAILDSSSDVLSDLEDS